MLGNGSTESLSAMRRRIAEEEKDVFRLHSMVLAGDIETLRKTILKTKSINLNVTNEFGQSLIKVAVERGLLHFAALLRKHGADMSKSKFDGWSLLHTACYHGQFQIVEWLLDECKMDMEAVNKMGFKPLHLCIAQDRMYIFKYLIDRGAIYDSKTGYSALHVAGFMGRLEIGSYLISLGVDINQKNDQGNTPLHLACSEGEIDMVRLLIDYGADCCIPNDEELLPFEKAHADVKDLIIAETAYQHNRNTSCEEMIKIAKIGVLSSLPMEIAIIILECIVVDINLKEFILLSKALFNPRFRKLLSPDLLQPGNTRASKLISACKRLTFR